MEYKYNVNQVNNVIKKVINKKGFKKKRCSYKHLFFYYLTILPATNNDLFNNAFAYQVLKPCAKPPSGVPSN